jgi:AraC-like DNA-binding protein
MKPPYESYKFDWLVGPEQPEAVFRPENGDVDWIPYPLAPEIGAGGFQKVELALGMSVFRAVHRFQPAAVGQLIPLAEIEAVFPEPAFMAQITRGGHILHRELYPAGELIFGPGYDLFRLTDKLHLIPTLDGSFNSEMTCLTLSQTMLGHLIGPEIAERLVASLGLLPSPQVRVRQIPLSVSAHLHGAISAQLTGAARKLHCQARLLDYLVALTAQVLGQAMPKERPSEQERAHALHDQLMNTEGKLPTLNELAVQFGRSVRSLNDEFTAAYGQSIVAFITEQRFAAAHAAILSSATPLKTLAARLGYSHVNHFSTVFKKRFGYAPGSLRRGRSAGTE